MNVRMSVACNTYPDILHLTRFSTTVKALILDEIVLLSKIQVGCQLTDLYSVYFRQKRNV